MFFFLASSLLEVYASQINLSPRIVHEIEMISLNIS